jgi:hypothetical protein
MMTSRIQPLMALWIPKKTLLILCPVVWRHVLKKLMEMVCLSNWLVYMRVLYVRSVNNLSGIFNY